MMPRIEAQEKVDAIMVAQLANPISCADPLDQEREQARRQGIFDRLQRKAAGEPDPVPAKANPADLAAMGIGVQAGGDDLPQIASLEDWLGTGSSSAAVGEQERSSEASQEGLNDA